jgi:hypothetical protein
MAVWSFEIAVSTESGIVERNRIHKLSEWREGQVVPNGLQQESFVQVVGPQTTGPVTGVEVNVDGSLLTLDRWNIDDMGECRWSYAEQTTDGLGRMTRMFGYAFERIN